MSPHKPNGFRALADGLGAALQWRLLLLWAVGLLLPTLVAVLPVWRALSERLDQSLMASDLAKRFDLVALLEVIKPLVQDGSAALSGSGLAGLLLTLLLAPWLTGMVVTSIRAGQVLRFGNLLQGGLREYGRMARMLLWAIIPLGVLGALGALPMGWAERQAQHAILEATGENAQRIALVVFAVLVLFGHATLEAGRGVLAADPARRSVVKAWWRGLLLVVRRPLASAVVYLGTTLLALALAALLGAARTQLDAGTPLGFVAGLLVVQLLVAAIAWGRAARLYGMADLARGEQHRRARRVVADAPAAQHADAVPGTPVAELAVV